jgi:hypothetical protein
MINNNEDQPEIIRGYFNKSGKAGFTMDTLNLPVPWEYIYQNGKILLKVDQFGPVYVQADPPSDIMLFKRDSMQKYSSWITWIKSPAFSGGAFCNFFRPNLLTGNPGVEPDNYKTTYSPECAVYSFQWEGIAVTTELFCAFDEAAIIMKLYVKNMHSEAIPVTLLPAMLPYVNPAVLAPWDRPEWYLKSGFGCEDKFAFWTQLSNMNSEKEKRRAVTLLTEKDGLSSVEISYERYVGQGTFDRPEALYGNGLGREPKAGAEWGKYNKGNCIYGYPPVYAQQYDYILQPGETKTVTQVLGMTGNDTGNELPDRSSMKALEKFFDPDFCDAEKDRVRVKYEKFLGIRRLDSPDQDLNYYVNEWLPLQMYWVASLDRGWPSGMRGSRDSANDFTAMIPLDSGWSAGILETLMSCQRSDGWFPRQYSALGRNGKHDMRGHVDAGAWVIELLYEYLCHTKDTEVLFKMVPWLDSDSEDTVLAHSLRTMEYYIDSDHIGEHGLCKIGEGDWLDSVNRAGIEGRGESVTVTNQVIIALTYMIEILMLIKDRQNMAENLIPDGTAEKYLVKKLTLKENLQKHAFNKEGYFNSVFNDDGKWLFSDCDPDGKKRVYGPANWYSIISGTTAPEQADSVLRTLEFLKSEMGYRLYWPPMGDIPIDKVGRSGSGDLMEGLWENGNVYNQGSHGFLGRALATAGEGDLLYETLQYLLPYDQERHPTSKTLTPPYAVVNCWQQVPGFIHRGGLSFLTGSIAMGLRLVYDWMLGIKPVLEGLAIDPCIPSGFKTLNACFCYRGKPIRMEIDNSSGRQNTPDRVILNGMAVLCRKPDFFSGRKMHLIQEELFKDGDNCILVIM